MQNSIKFLFINNYKIKIMLNYKTKVNMYTANLKHFFNHSECKILTSFMEIELLAVICRP